MEAKLEGEKNLHEVRVGWSADDTAFTLGEGARSFCYSGTAKKGSDCKFEDYGAAFAAGDVVTAYAELSGGDAVVLSFAKNGEDQGEAFSIPKYV